MTPRSLFGTAALLVATLTAFSGFAITVGRQMPINPAMAGFNVNCEQRPRPCWYGIVPGETTVAETHRIVTELGYEPSHRPSFGYITYGLVESAIPCSLNITYRSSTAPIATIQFHDCTRLQFGDLANQWGQPNTLMPGKKANALQYRSIIEIILQNKTTSPFNPISEFSLKPNLPVQDALAPMWRGFRPQAWYCRDLYELFGIGNRIC
jgi:hypothetical protein